MITAAYLRDKFQQEYVVDPKVIARAPGRLEILGNHTDYNEGLVLSAAVDRATFLAARACDGTICRIWDIRCDSRVEFSLQELSNPVAGEWCNYIKGILLEFRKRGIEPPAFDAVLTSEIPLSAGMSSSAALEMATVLVVKALAHAQLDWRECARIGQACENNYVGANTGLLDQFSSLRGRRKQLVHSDFRDLSVRNVPLCDSAALVVANSMVKHTLTNEYNERRERCEEAARLLARHYTDVQTLRDVNSTILQQARNELPELTYRRALHIVAENERVIRGVAALNEGDLKTFGELMFASHQSSRHNFANSCEELDRLVDISRKLPGIIGSRLSGGGFGGITVHLVYDDCADTFRQQLAEQYAEQTGLDCETMICHAADGAELLLSNP